MGIRDLVIYTHSDYRDAWIPLLKSLKKYAPEFKLHFFVNEKDEFLSEYRQIIYDENLNYTQRLKDSFDKIEIDEFIFMHEDMFLYDFPKLDYIDIYSKLLKEKKIGSVKLIPVGSHLMRCAFEETLYITEYSKFSIQPTIISKSRIIDILNDVVNLNIWDFESSIKSTHHDYIAKIGGEKKVGIFHYESLVFPYIATAIVKGKWNFSEYPILAKILEECQIDSKIRGVL
jgi:hypothetical protein